uniref:Ribosomal protein L13 n=1 Tax=Rhodymenia pseudopalmata TaxID=31502 RepID=A0A1C9C7V2_RHOPU|nr:ribosomal protein L13 [Rhodymenia pseudopalmata]AOM64457.1 ribosomal protein L13 [Rhodymenia pseudopalmata]
MNRTYVPNQKNKNKLSKWYLIDAKNQTLGRLSTCVANILLGKHETEYTPYLCSNNYVIIINAKYICVTGNKKYNKLYKRHSGRPGGMKIECFEQLKKRIPGRIMEKSIKGMLGKGPMGYKLFKQLKIYKENQHPHLAQKPYPVSLN